jgi:hypothetical protein
VVRPLKAEPAGNLAADETVPPPQAVIPARDGTEPLARRFSARAVAGAAGTATTPPSWPQGPAHRGARMIRTTTVIWNAQLAQLERRAIRCLAAPAADGELTGELGTPQRNAPGKPGSGPGKGHVRLLQRLQRRHRYR